MCSILYKLNLLSIAIRILHAKSTFKPYRKVQEQYFGLKGVQQSAKFKNAMI